MAEKTIKAVSFVAAGAVIFSFLWQILLGICPVP